MVSSRLTAPPKGRNPNPDLSSPSYGGGAGASRQARSCEGGARGAAAQGPRFLGAHAGKYRVYTVHIAGY
jgi:hypothetical protein